MVLIMDKKLFLTITGGGTEAIGKILRNGGASSYFAGAYVPYSTKCVDDFLGFKPEKYNSQLTSRQLAMAGMQKMLDLGYDFNECVSLACCASLRSSNVERVGREHSFHITYLEREVICSTSFKLLENRSRQEEEELVSEVILDGLEMGTFHLSEDEWDCVKSEKFYFQHEEDTPRLFFDTKEQFALKQVIINSEKCSNLIYSGSFNPLHDGHRAIINYSANKFKQKVTLDISVQNFDKPNLDYLDYRNRSVLYKENNINAVCFTKAPLFIDKFHLYPINSTYLVGVDTANRIIRHKESLGKLLEYCFIYNNKFAVFPRGNEKLISGYENFFEFQEDFVPVDLSSRSIRNAAGV